MTLELLAHRLFEKESIVRRVEEQHMKPDPQLAKKLEKELEISLTEKTGENAVQADKNPGAETATGMTLGDFIKIKKK
jgi:putative transcription factor